MHKAIEKLIAEYESKINDQDVLISHYKETIRDKCRTYKDPYFDRLESARADARRMAYIQAKVDIESLLDYLD